MINWIRRMLKTSPSGPKNSFSLKYENIPPHSERGLAHLAYPQTQGRALEPQNAQFFCRRYADEIHQMLFGLPLSKDEINRLVMPVLTKLFDIINVLPASEYNHHAGSGGLLLHSLQCASAATAFAESVELTVEKSLKNRYNNRQRWILAAALTGLGHDVGKIYDMEVVSDNGDKWNPFQCSLSEWCEQLKITRFYVIWKEHRVHKQHQLRSLRVIYKSLFHDELIRYLSEVTGDEILGAIDEAIVLGTGPLATVLRQAESASIKKDSEARRRLGSGSVSDTPPLSAVILQAVNALIMDGVWKVNQKGGRVYVTTEGVFIVLTDVAAQEIHHKACSFHAPYVPATAPGIAQAMYGNVDANFRRINLGKEIGPCEHCLLIEDEARVFQGLTIPDRLPLSKTDEQKKTVGQFMAPQTEFSTVSPTSTEKQPEASGQQADHAQKELLTPEKIRMLEGKQLSASEAKTFVDQLIATLCSQMQGGAGFLIEALRTNPDGDLVCSSVRIEQVLDQVHIRGKSQEMLLRMKRPKPTVEFDSEKHRFVLVKKDSNEI